MLEGEGRGERQGKEKRGGNGKEMERTRVHVFLNFLKNSLLTYMLAVVCYMLPQNKMSSGQRVLFVRTLLQDVCSLPQQRGTV